MLDRLPPEAVAGPEKKLWGVKDDALAKYWRLRTSAFHGIVTWAPTIDPERLKLLSQEMLIEAGVRLVFHSWMSVPIVEDGAVKGIVFESKEGRQALYIALQIGWAIPALPVQPLQTAPPQNMAIVQLHRVHSQAPQVERCLSRPVCSLCPDPAIRFNP